AVLGDETIRAQRREGRLGLARPVAHGAHAALPLGRCREPGVLAGEGGGGHTLEQLPAGGGYRDAVGLVIAGEESVHVRGRERLGAEGPRRRQAGAQRAPLAREATNAEPPRSLPRRPRGFRRPAAPPRG